MPTTTTLEPDVVDEEHVTDEQLLAELVKDWSIPCEFRVAGPDGPKCGARATWWLICRSCAHPWAECTRHRTLEAAAWELDPCRFVACDRCGAQTMQGLWRRLVLITPIGARP